MPTRSAIKAPVRAILETAHESHDSEYAQGLRLRARADRFIKRAITVAVDTVPNTTCSVSQRGPMEYWLTFEVNTQREADRVYRAVSKWRNDALDMQPFHFAVLVNKRVKYD